MAWQGCFSQHGPEGPCAKSSLARVFMPPRPTGRSLLRPISVSAGRQGQKAQATYAALIRPKNCCGMCIRNFCYTTLAAINPVPILDSPPQPLNDFRMISRHVDLAERIIR